MFYSDEGYYCCMLVILSYMISYTSSINILLFFELFIQVPLKIDFKNRIIRRVESFSKPYNRLEQKLK